MHTLPAACIYRNSSTVWLKLNKRHGWWAWWSRNRDARSYCVLLCRPALASVLQYMLQKSRLKHILKLKVIFNGDFTLDILYSAKPVQTSGEQLKLHSYSCTSSTPRSATHIQRTLHTLMKSSLLTANVSSTVITAAPLAFKWALSPGLGL